MRAQKNKQPKKTKVVKTDGEDNLSNASAKEMTVAPGKHLEKYVVELEKLFKAVNESNDTIMQSSEEKGWAENLPRYIQPHHHELLERKSAFDEKVGIIKESQLVEWKAVQEEVGEMKRDATGLLRKTAFQIEEAKTVGRSAAPKEKPKRKPTAKPAKKA